MDLSRTAKVQLRSFNKGEPITFPEKLEAERSFRDLMKTSLVGYLVANKVVATHNVF